MTIRPPVVAAVLALMAATGCVAEPSATPTTAAPTTVTEPPTTLPPTALPPTTLPPTTLPPDPVETLVASLTVDQKVGQLLMPVLSGTSAVAPTAAEAAANQRIAGVDSISEAMQSLHLGGVIYLGPNIGDADQVRTLSAEIDQAARSVLVPVGPFIAVDQEGGRVNRIRDGVQLFPSARDMSGDADAVRSAASTTAAGLVEQGINVVFAPVADLTSGNAGVIGNRSYGDDPRLVAEMVVASVEGLQGAGVAAAVKHWPGHGATTLDSHEVLPSIDVDPATWRERERVPFEAAVDVGVAMVMVGHLALPGLDASGSPATVSSVLVDALLRSELGFDGVVITDALDMGAVEDQDRAELAVQAIEAGVDILLAPPDVVVAHQALVEAVESGRISAERLDASVERVLRLKQRLGLVDRTGA